MLVVGRRTKRSARSSKKCSLEPVYIHNGDQGKSGCQANSHLSSQGDALLHQGDGLARSPVQLPECQGTELDGQAPHNMRQVRSKGAICTKSSIRGGGTINSREKACAAEKAESASEAEIML